MDQNKAAVKALREYAAIKEPGYAFMIEAPWGAGKTHLVLNEFSGFFPKRARYASLNGVSDAKAFRRALLATTSEGNLTDAVGKLGNTLGGIAKLPNFGGLIQDSLENQMINDLPNLLVFDDVERCELPASELLGLLNDFVEHQKKNVVLCAYIERDDQRDQPKRDDFLVRKEKVVGRTVRIVADTENAIPVFIQAMPDGQGKKWFEQNEMFLHEVFRETSYSNLRILRQCLHDCGRVLNILEKEILESTGAMYRFVRTYFVLSMAVASNELSVDFLGKRLGFSAATSDQDVNLLNKFAKKHPHAEVIVNNSSCILPVELGVSLIGIGYEDPKEINKALRGTGQFSGGQDLPLWHQFVKWRKLSRTELEETYKQAENYVFKEETIEPGPFLHLSCDLISIAKYSQDDGRELVDRVLERINKLSDEGKIPAAEYGYDFGYDADGGTFTFGGFGFDVDDSSKKVIDAMKSAQELACRQSMGDVAERLLWLLNEDFDLYKESFVWNQGFTGYRDAEILCMVDPARFAAAVFKHIELGNVGDVGSELESLSERINNKKKKEEIEWAKSVSKELINLANEANFTEAARMVWLQKQHWTFP